MRKISSCLIILIFFCCFTVPATAVAGSPGQAIERQGEGISGNIAAWLFALANLTVVLSLLTRFASGPGRLGPDRLESIKKWDRLQRRHIRRFHYFLNPAAILVAALHWSFSECGPLSFQKWALPLLGLWAVLGLMLKLHLSPRRWRTRVFRLHTTWVLPAVFFLLAAVGHIMP